MTHLALASLLIDVGRSLRESFLMFWETLWALVLGFSLSGVVQAFVSKEQMQAKLGNHRPAAIGRAAGYGMVSSSCSYAASAMSKSLFAKGADFVAATTFMIASTNLVVELGIVLLVLLGWQFMAAEFVGGPIMIVLLALLGGFVFRTAIVEASRRRIVSVGPSSHEQGARCAVSAERQEELEQTPWSAKLRSWAGWSDAASYAVSDIRMLRKELAIGYGVAGFLAVLVPASVWNGLFMQGHGFWTSLENALVGPLIAVVSWVCSIGNVPLAAALWSGGISFGGVISFIFADLIAMPLILVYRKLYGAALTLRIVGLFYILMATAGLATEGLFGLFHAIPATRTIRVTSGHFEWNYTIYLNLVFITGASGVWWLARNRGRFGGGRGYAIDPVCGMQVRTADAPAQASFGGQRYSFCSDRCREQFEANPERYTADGATPETMRSHDVLTASRTSTPAAAQTATAIDQICGMAVETATAPAHRSVRGVDYWFCNPGCAATFDGDPARYAAPTTAPSEYGG
jgi:YHS domain-containing protein/uncharacterized membrane protein YraQ (UPF0718 family)